MEAFVSVNQSNSSTIVPELGGIWVIVEEFGPANIALNYVVFLIAVVTVVCDALAVYLVHRNRKFPLLCRALSINYIISDLSGAAIFSVHQILIFVCGYQYDIVFTSRISWAAVFTLISSATVAFLSVERVVALISNIKQTREISGKTIAAIIAVIWVFNGGQVLVLNLVPLGTVCGWGQRECYLFNAIKWYRYAGIVTVLIYDLILVITNLMIQRVVRRHVTQINKQQAAVGEATAQDNNITNNIGQQEFETWKIIGHILLSYFLLHVPITVTHILHELFNDMRHSILFRCLRGFSLVCMQICSFMYLYLYVFKLKENRLNMYVLFSHVLKKYKAKADQLRMDVYNITVSTSSRNRSIPTTGK